MARCFPFDPSKYVRKTTTATAAATEDPDLLKKEKHREKKHKKEKRDKEKKEGKEKRDKERSDDKHKEKKEKKDKHKDKKKDKEKHRDKDKHKTDSSLPDEKKSVVLPGPQIPVPSEKSKDNRTNDRSATPMVEKRVAPGLAASQNGEVVGKNSHLGSENKGSKYPPEMGWRSPDEEKRPNVQMPDKNHNMERKKDGLFKLSSGKSPGPVVDGKERSKERASLDVRMDERAIPGEPRFSGNARVPPPNSVGMAQNRVGGLARPMVVDRKIDLRMEGKEKSKERERERDDGKGEKSREKEKRKEEKVKATSEEKVKGTSEQKHVELSRMMEPGSKNQLPKPIVKNGSKKEFPSATHNSGIQNVPRNSSNHSSGPVTVSSSLGKRKDFGLNGSYDEHTSGPNKLARTTPMENGRSMMMDPPNSQTSPATQQRTVVKVDPTLAPTNHTQKPPVVSVNAVKAEPTKDRKINGMITTTQTPSQSKADRKPDVVPPAIARGPHPDAKYLSQVLSVPKLDELPSFDDDQDWLFSSSSRQQQQQQQQQQRNPEAESSSTPQVWAKALWLEPVDIHALPYVIPH